MRLPRTLSKIAGAALAAIPPQMAGPATGRGVLTELGVSFDNPGGLQARMFVPDGLAPGAPLVVILHGCTQTAADYDAGSGWSGLAARHGFALLYPEQTRANNPNVCFNWFRDGDVARGQGEVASIAAMIGAMRTAHAIDPAQIFITGLSAGGAMAAAMLATYPELFAAGAIIAGLPYGSASGVHQALEAMGGRSAAVDAATLGARVRAASPHAASWPRVSVWHGGADHTVAPANGTAVVRQWTDVHGLPPAPTRTDSVEGYHHSIWARGDGMPIVEHILIDGMGHGTPLRPGTGLGRSGQARAHMLDVGISSTDRIAAFFGLAPADAGRDGQGAEPEHPPGAALAGEHWLGASPTGGPHKVIEDALRAAGLMR